MAGGRDWVCTTAGVPAAGDNRRRLRANRLTAAQGHGWATLGVPLYGCGGGLGGGWLLEGLGFAGAMSMSGGGRRSSNLEAVCDSLASRLRLIEEENHRLSLLTDKKDVAIRLLLVMKGALMRRLRRAHVQVEDMDWLAGAHGEQDASSSLADFTFPVASRLEMGSSDASPFARAFDATLGAEGRQTRDHLGGSPEARSPHGGDLGELFTEELLAHELVEMDAARMTGDQRDRCAGGTIDSPPLHGPQGTPWERHLSQSMARRDGLVERVLETSEERLREMNTKLNFETRILEDVIAQNETDTELVAKLAQARYASVVSNAENAKLRTLLSEYQVEKNRADLRAERTDDEMRKLKKQVEELRCLAEQHAQAISEEATKEDALPTPSPVPSTAPAPAPSPAPSASRQEVEWSATPASNDGEEERYSEPMRNDVSVEAGVTTSSPEVQVGETSYEAGRSDEATDAGLAGDAQEGGSGGAFVSKGVGADAPMMMDGMVGTADAFSDASGEDEETARELALTLDVYCQTPQSDRTSSEALLEEALFPTTSASKEEAPSHVEASSQTTHLEASCQTLTFDPSDGESDQIETRGREMERAGVEVCVQTNGLTQAHSSDTRGVPTKVPAGEMPGVDVVVRGRDGGRDPDQRSQQVAGVTAEETIASEEIAANENPPDEFLFPVGWEGQERDVQGVETERKPMQIAPHPVIVSGAENAQLRTLLSEFQNEKTRAHLRAENVCEELRGLKKQVEKFQRSKPEPPVSSGGSVEKEETSEGSKGNMRSAVQEKEAHGGGGVDNAGCDDEGAFVGEPPPEKDHRNVENGTEEAIGNGESLLPSISEPPSGKLFPYGPPQQRAVLDQHEHEHDLHGLSHAVVQAVATAVEHIQRANAEARENEPPREAVVSAFDDDLGGDTTRAEDSGPESQSSDADSSEAESIQREHSSTMQSTADSFVDNKDGAGEDAVRNDAAAYEQEGSAADEDIEPESDAALVMPEKCSEGPILTSVSSIDDILERLKYQGILSKESPVLPSHISQCTSSDVVRSDQSKHEPLEEPRPELAPTPAPPPETEAKENIRDHWESVRRATPARKRRASVANLQRLIADVRSADDPYAALKETKGTRKTSEAEETSDSVLALAARMKKERMRHEEGQENGEVSGPVHPAPAPSAVLDAITEIRGLDSQIEALEEAIRLEEGKTEAGSLREDGDAEEDDLAGSEDGDAPFRRDDPTSEDCISDARMARAEEAPVEVTSVEDDVSVHSEGDSSGEHRGVENRTEASDGSAHRADVSDEEMEPKSERGGGSNENDSSGLHGIELADDPTHPNDCKDAGSDGMVDGIGEGVDDCADAWAADDVPQVPPVEVRAPDLAPESTDQVPAVEEEEREKRKRNRRREKRRRQKQVKRQQELMAASGPSPPTAQRNPSPQDIDQDERSTTESTMARSTGAPIGQDHSQAEARVDSPHAAETNGMPKSASRKERRRRQRRRARQKRANGPREDAAARDAQALQESPSPHPTAPQTEGIAGDLDERVDETRARSVESVASLESCESPALALEGLRATDETDAPAGGDDGGKGKARSEACGSEDGPSDGEGRGPPTMSPFVPDFGDDSPPQQQQEQQPPPPQGPHWRRRERWSTIRLPKRRWAEWIPNRIRTKLRTATSSSAR